TRGFWKAWQSRPGVIEWTSPGGRIYRTEPHLSLAPGQAQRNRESGEVPAAGTRDSNPDDYGDDPPPF
ncbi:hypothetical protein ABIB35_002745, partial [Arthrobacter sp. UYP6]|uniref:hypothetical protein n=1 Tax=Arthrobacter sp. UYP6 TaxID=1756378 RepID=UPI003397A912